MKMQKNQWNRACAFSRCRWTD